MLLRTEADGALGFECLVEIWPEELAPSAMHAAVGKNGRSEPSICRSLPAFTESEPISVSGPKDLRCLV